RIHVVSEIVAGETPSTRTALQALAQVTGPRLLVVLSRTEDVAWLSLRNVATVHALAADQLNAYDVLLADDVVFTTAALADFTGAAASEAEEEK
ncbi:MAG: 50S ribosomal protein L4, partial [Propionicimonas sp.]|nr:50S ribosomal protein L4 [Propionicimonas sp.]